MNLSDDVDINRLIPVYLLIKSKFYIQLCKTLCDH